MRIQKKSIIICTGVLLLYICIGTFSCQKPVLYVDLVKTFDSLFVAQDYEQALVIGRQAFKKAKEEQMAVSDEMLFLVNRLGIAAVRSRRYSMAQEYYKDVLVMMESKRSFDTISHLNALSNLGKSYKLGNNISKALTTMQKVVETRVLVDTNRYQLSYEYLTLGQVYGAIGNYVEAIAALQQAYDILIEVSNDFIPVTQVSIFLSYIYIQAGQYDKAEQIAVQLQEQAKKITGNQSYVYAEVLSLIATVHAKKQNYIIAEQYLQKAISIMDDYPTTQTSLPYSFLSLADIYSNQGKYDQAEHFFHQSIDMRRQMYGKEDVVVGDMMYSYAQHLLRYQKYVEAEKTLYEVLVIYQAGLVGVNSPKPSQAQNLLDSVRTLTKGTVVP